jgi:hypothetical protein
MENASYRAIHIKALCADFRYLEQTAGIASRRENIVENAELHDPWHGIGLTARRSMRFAASRTIDVRNLSIKKSYWPPV